jgi:hypothetical protein
MVTNAHRVEIEVGADGHASAPPSRADAAAPLAEASKWTDLLPQVKFAYNATRALGIEHTPLEANFGFSPEEPHDLIFSTRPSIPVSQDASKRLRLLHEIHALVRSVL